MPVTYSRIMKQNPYGATHRWFYFTDDGFKETAVPRNAPKRYKKPWTEAVRITSSVVINDTAYFLVNKSGLLVCPPASGVQTEGIASKTMLIKDTAAFASAACGSLFCIDETPVFNLFTNSIFSPEKNAESVLPEKNDPFLIQYVKENRAFVPVLRTVDFDWPADAEVRELFFIDGVWHALLKKDNMQRTEFYAYAFYSVEPITSFARTRISSQAGVSGGKPQIVHTEIGIQDFREKIRPLSASAMPDKLKHLLLPVPPSVPWYLEYTADDFPAPVRFVQGAHAPDPRQAYAVSSRNYSAALFEDGTVCFAGTLPMKHVLNGGKTSVFKLPRLPAGYTYTCAAVAGSTLIAAWEETTFFETGKSGFLAVDLERILYNDEEIMR